MTDEIANAARVIEWARTPNRKPANTAFTAGPERQAAYWIEWAQNEGKVPARILVQEVPKETLQSARESLERGRDTLRKIKDSPAPSLYYEAHITIEPVFDAKLDLATKIATDHGFKIANLLMQKRKEDSPERSKHDTFMTGHHIDMDRLTVQMVALVTSLKEAGLVVWRYKIEDVVLDSKVVDKYKLLIPDTTDLGG